MTPEDTKREQGRLHNQEAAILWLHSELERVKKELAFERSCTCHRIPSKDWHLDRCPAKTPKKSAV
jgi:hypothetical protein